MPKLVATISIMFYDNCSNVVISQLPKDDSMIDINQLNKLLSEIKKLESINHVMLNSKNYEKENDHIL